MRQFSKILIIVMFISFFAISFASAQGLVPCGRTADNPCELGHLVVLIIQVINFFIGLSWMIALFFMFWGSYNMVTAYGNSEKLETAKSIFKNAVIGFFLILVAFILTNFVAVALTGYTLSDRSNPTSILRFLPFPTGTP